MTQTAGDTKEEILRDAVLRLSQAKSQAEIDNSVDSIMNDIESKAFNSDSAEEKAQLDFIASVVHEYAKHHGKDNSTFHVGLEGQRMEVTFLESEAKELTRKIFDLQAELRQVEIKRDYSKMKYERLQDVERMLKITTEE